MGNKEIFYIARLVDRYPDIIDPTKGDKKIQFISVINFSGKKSDFKITENKEGGTVFGSRSSAKEFIKITNLHERQFGVWKYVENYGRNQLTEKYSEIFYLKEKK